MGTKFRAGILMIALVSAGLTGCGKTADTASSAGVTPSQPLSPEGEIRAAIQAHLAHKGNLNLQSFETEVKQVTIQGNHAQAQVEFRVKNGPGAMELTYQLQDVGGVWSVVDTNPDGSNFSHPPLNKGQSTTTGAPVGMSHSLSDTLRSFKAGSAAPQQSLPPGHPPISAAPNSAQ